MALKPYKPAQSLPNMVRLNANESPYTLFDKNEDMALNMYPQAVPAKIRNAVADYLNLNVEKCVVTRGSTEAIDLLTRVFCRPKIDEVIIFPPTFEMYQVYASIQGAKIKSVPLLENENYALDISELKRQITPKSKLTFLTSPSSPIGHSFSKRTIFEVCKTLRSFGLLILDAAYIEFADKNYTSELLNEFDNIVVLRTLSKAFGLAGSRCGAMLSSKAICDLVMRVVPPYSFSVPAEQSVLRALSDKGIKNSKNNIKKIIEEREYLLAEFSKIDCIKKVFPSDANFILLRVEDADQFYQRAMDVKLLVRNVSYQPTLENCIRVTVGSREQNNLLIKAIG